MKYSNPPVVETVLSVQFKPLANVGAAHLGAFWTELGPDWPHVGDMPAVDPVFEQFGTTSLWDHAAIVKLSSKVDLRLQIRNKTKDRMIQVQNGRFSYNWLGTPGADYPEYDAVRSEFDTQWDRFRTFLAKVSDEGQVQPNQWEVIYVNHMPQGTVWNEANEFSNVLTFLNRPHLEDLALSIEGIGGEWKFEICPKRGRLYLKLGSRTKEDIQCLVMTFIARGPVGDTIGTLDDGIELGHQTIAAAFDRLTSPDAKKKWGIDDGEDVGD